MLIELRLEVLKVLRRPRTYVGPVAMGLLIAAVLVGLKYSHPFDNVQKRLAQDFIICGSFINAAFLTRYLLDGIVYMFLPLFTCVVCGDLIASEAADGTLRALLCRPVKRSSVAASKYAVCVAYVLALVLGTGLAAYLAGSVFLGRGSLVLHEEGIWILPERTAIGRLVAAYVLVAAGMVAVGSISFMISTFLSNSNGAIAVAIGIMYGSAVIGQIDYFAKLRPYLLTTHLDKWQHFFTGALDVQLLARSVAALLIYSALALLIGLLIFERRDVLS